MSSRLFLSFRPVALALLISAVGVLPCGAEQRPTPTPTRPAGGGEKSLTDIAKNKQLKGGENGKAIVITNENLPDYAAKGELTTAETHQKQAVRPLHDGGAVVRPSDSGAKDERMRFWQGKYRRQLEIIAALKQQIETLDYEIPGLWRDFYARDDPAYRDGVIKPKIDQSLKDREDLEARLHEEEPRLQEIKEAARREGAEPGWFRGIKEPTRPPVSPTPELIKY